MIPLVYFSATGNTERFARKIPTVAHQIPRHAESPPLLLTEPFVLLTPSYGAGKPAGSVPKPVIRFLNDPANRALLLGVIGAGNRNFGNGFCLAATLVAEKCGVPVLHRLEIFGLPEDAVIVTNILTELDTP